MSKNNEKKNKLKKGEIKLIRGKKNQVRLGE